MILEWQAVLGYDVGPLTFGEIAHAVSYKIDRDLTTQSELTAAIGNAPHFKPRRREGYRPEDFYRPVRQRKQPSSRLTPERLRSMKPLFKKHQ